MPGDRFEVLSTDTIQSFVRPHTIAAMEELAIDISDHRSKSVEEFTGQEFDYVITVCDNAKESCPVFHDKTQRVHWTL
jgi:arsenate reductase (thioredoxin)